MKKAPPRNKRAGAGQPSLGRREPRPCLISWSTLRRSTMKRQKLTRRAAKSGISLRCGRSLTPTQDKRPTAPAPQSRGFFSVRPPPPMRVGLSPIEVDARATVPPWPSNRPNNRKSTPGPSSASRPSGSMPARSTRPMSRPRFAGMIEEYNVPPIECLKLIALQQS